MLKLSYYKTVIEIFCIQTSLNGEISLSLNGESGNWDEIYVKLLLQNQTLWKSKYNLVDWIDNLYITTIFVPCKSVRVIFHGVSKYCYSLKMAIDNS